MILLGLTKAFRVLLNTSNLFKIYHIYASILLTLEFIYMRHSLIVLKIEIYLNFKIQSQSKNHFSKLLKRSFLRLVLVPEEHHYDIGFCQPIINRSSIIDNRMPIKPQLVCCA